MIRCTKCDTVNPDNAVFCSNCASFLEWTGEKIDAATAAALSQAPAAKPTDSPAQIPPETESPTATRAEAKPQPTPAAKPRPEPEVKPQPVAEVKPEPTAEVKAEPESEPEVNAEPEPEVKPQPEDRAKPEPAVDVAAAKPAQRRRRSKKEPAPVAGAGESVSPAVPAGPAIAAETEQAAEPPPTRPPREEPTIAARTATDPVAKPTPPVAEPQELAAAAAEAKPATPPPPETKPAFPAATPTPPAARPWVAPPPPPPPPPIRRPGEPVVHHLDQTPPELRTEAGDRPATTPPPADKPKPTFRFRAASATITTSAASTPAPTSGGPAAGKPAARPPAAQPATSQPASSRPSTAAGAAAAGAGAAGAAAGQAAAMQPAARRPTAEVDQPASRKPTAEVAPRPQSRPSQVQPLVPQQPIKPGDLICSNCGAGNDPARRFCRRCGTSLATAVVARKPPWYRRLFRRGERAYAAGERPGAMGEAGQPRRSIVKPVALILILVVVGGLIAGYVFDSGFKRTVDGLIGSVGGMVDTTSHQANLAFDGDVATYWLSDPSGGTPTATVPLTETVNLLKVLVHSGAGAGPEFDRYRRPKTIEFVFPSLAPIRKVLADDPAAQEFDLKVPAVATYVFKIIDYYPASDASQKLIALREVELTASAQP